MGHTPSVQGRSMQTLLDLQSLVDLLFQFSHELFSPSTQFLVVRRVH